MLSGQEKSAVQEPSIVIEDVQWKCIAADDKEIKSNKKWRHEPKSPTFRIKKEKLSAANMRMCSFLCASRLLYKLWGGKRFHI